MLAGLGRIGRMGAAGFVVSASGEGGLDGWHGARDNETLEAVEGGVRATALAEGVFGASYEVSGLTPDASYTATLDITIGDAGDTYCRVDSDPGLTDSTYEDTASTSRSVQVAFTAAAEAMYVGAVAVAGEAGQSIEIANVDVTADP